ncbi:MAG: hypothetical protein IPG96_07575 [Proteobacteria bacterium]|nr:hypothetical protein [Pseudomonadota bacterium]
MSELLFHPTRSRAKRIAHWMLEEKLGEPYRTVWLDYGAAMKDAAYRRSIRWAKIAA